MEEDDDNSVSSENDNIEVEKKLDWLVPEIRRRESTMDAFNRLTLQRPWIPFHSGKGRKTAVDDEEEALFEAMKVKYNRRAPPRSHRGYYAFMNAWNVEVANRYRRKTEGEEDIVIINRKSIQQLQ